MKKITGKQILAWLLSAAIFTASLPSVLAEEDIDGKALTDELLSYGEQYPEGAFAFRDAQLSADENSGETYIYVVRYDSFE